jgi:hypothetical protein
MAIEVQVIDGEIFTKYGFPVEECTRCFGTGQHSYNEINGRTCLKCWGSGYTIQKRALTAYKAMQEEIKSHNRCETKDLKTGDSIAHNRKWKKIESVEFTDQVCGSQEINGVRKEWVFMIIKFNNGETLKSSETNLHRRRHKVDIKKYLAMIEPTKSAK